MPSSVRFRGTTAECFSAFVRDVTRRRSEDELLVVRGRIARLLDIGEPTVRRWFRSGGDLDDSAKFRAKTKLFLELAGYHQTDRDRSTSEVRELFSNFAFGLVSLSELVERFGTTQSSVQRALTGESLLTLDKIPIVEEINTRFREKNRELVELWKKEILNIMGEDEIGETVSSTHKSVVQSSLEDQELRSFVVLVLADIVSATHRLASRVVGDSFTSAERRFLRSLCEKSGRSVASCSIVLNALCGERATESYRDELKQKQNGE